MFQIRLGAQRIPRRRFECPNESRLPNCRYYWADLRDRVLGGVRCSLLCTRKEAVGFRQGRKYSFTGLLHTHSCVRVSISTFSSLSFRDLCSKIRLLGV